MYERYYIQASFWGIIAGLGFIFPSWWLLTFLALGFWFYSLRALDTAKQFFISGWLFGIAKTLVVLSWFWSTYPAVWLGLEAGFMHLSLVVLYWLPAAMTLGVGTGLFALGYQKLQKRKVPTTIMIGVVAVMWVLGEVLGAYVFSLYTLGPNASLTLGFSFGHLGYVVASSDLLLRLAKWGGVYMLSFVACASVVLIVSQTSVRNRLVIVVIMILCFIAPIPVLEQSDVGERVLVVEARFAADNGLSQREMEQIKFDLVRTALQSEAGAVLLPEDFRFTDYFDSPEEVLRFMQNVGGEDAVLIDSTTIETDEGNILRAFIYSTKDNSVSHFDKSYYVPQGEYIPYVYQAVLSLAGLSTEMEQLLKKHGEYYSEQTTQVVTNESDVPPVLFCFESVTPLGVQHIIKDRQQVSYIAHPVSHGWFLHHQELFWNQLRAMLRVQAMWAGVPILQSGNMVAAEVIAPEVFVETEVVMDTQWWKLTMVSL